MTPDERLALWETPAADLERAADQRPAKAWVRFGRGTQWQRPGTPPRLAVAVDSWGAWPEWRYNRETPRRRVWRCPAHWDQPGWWPTGMPSDRAPLSIPWGAAWHGSRSEDGGVLITKADDARYGIEALNVRPASWLDRFLIDWRMALSGSSLRTQDGDLICDQLAERTPENAGRYRGRGSGDTPKRTGITFAAEIAAGRIGHVIAATGITPWGPGVTRLGPLATRVEHPSTAPSGWPVGLQPGDQPETCAPAGTRMVLPITDAEIAAWCRHRGHVGALARTATVIVTALRDFGFAHGAESGRGDPTAETSGTRDEWARLGINNSSVASSLLDGLPFDRLEVWE